MHWHFAKNTNRSRRGDAVHPFLIVLLCLVVLAAAGYWGWTAWESYVTKQVEASAGTQRTPRGTEAEGGSNKISLPETAMTNDSVRALLEPWLREAWQQEGLKNPESEIITSVRWRPFVKAAIAEELDGPERVSRTRLLSMATDLHVDALRHPVAAAVVGHFLPDGEARMELLRFAYDSLSKQKAVETLTWQVACDLELTPDSTGASAAPTPGIGLNALRAALAATDGFSGDHDQLAAFKLLHGSRLTFLENTHEDFAKVVDAAPGVKPWLRHWVRGLHHIQTGWEARGGGYSNSVSTRGWKVFALELEKAQTELEAAWKDKPQHAGPAVSLIYASLGMKDKPLPRMRRWFKEAVAVHADVEEAYRHMLWGLRPRWYGSHAGMQAFGSECLQTKRFDTDAPWFFIVAHADCASEWDLPDYYYREFSRFDELTALFDGYESSPKRDAWRTHDRSVAALLNFKCGRYKEVQRWLEKLNFKPDERILEDWGLTADFVVGKTAAFAGDQSTHLVDAEKAEDKFRSSDARGNYRAGLDGAKDLSDLGKRYLRHRIAMMDTEAKFSAKESFQPTADEGFPGWSQVGEGWVSQAGVIARTGATGPAALTHFARVGPAFEVSGEIEITDPGDYAEAWITYGYPPPAVHPRWGAVRFVIDHGKATAVLSSQMGEPVHSSTFELAPKNAFVLDVNKGRLNLSINGRQVWEGVVQIDGAVKEAYAQFGVGGIASSARTQVRFGKLTLRKP